MAGRVIGVMQAENEALRLEMQRDPTVILMGEDVAGGAGRDHLGMADSWGGVFGVTQGLYTEFGPNRVIDMPISEAGFIGAAVGAAMTGLRPVVDLMFVDFVGFCLDQIMNQAAKMRYMSGGKVKVPLTVKTTTGAGVMQGAHHSQSLYSIFVHIPGLKVVAPSNSYNAKGLLIAAIRDDDPVIYCINKMLLFTVRSEVPEEPYTLPLGKADICKSGKDVTIIGISRMTLFCMDAAEQLAQQGIDAEVIDLLSLFPLDEDTILSSIQKTGKLVIVDEDNPYCNVASEIAALVADKAFDYLDAPIKRVCPPHTPVPACYTLESEYIPRAAKVISAVQSIVKKK